MGVNRIVMVLSVRAVGIETLRGEVTSSETKLASPIMQIGDWICINVANDTNEKKNFYAAIGGSFHAYPVHTLHKNDRD